LTDDGRDTHPTESQQSVAAPLVLVMLCAAQKITRIAQKMRVKRGCIMYWKPVNQC